jgi:hypothetical protein
VALRLLRRVETDPVRAGIEARHRLGQRPGVGAQVPLADHAGLTTKVMTPVSPYFNGQATAAKPPMVTATMMN